MPELPEVETIKNAIQKALKKASIEDISIYNHRLRTVVPDDLSLRLKGCKIKNYRRIAKYIVIDFENNLSLILHLGMSGKIKLSDNYEIKEKHDHIVFKTTEGYMVYNDPRRFGLCELHNTDTLASSKLFKNIGIDPFNNSLTSDVFYNKIKKKNISIKQTLLDQNIICGIGNIYASEALFLAKILPTRKANSLSQTECSILLNKIKETLLNAIKAGGSTLRDYKKPDGSLGYFQNSHCVYNKTGQPCPSCSCNLSKTGGIKKIIQNGRSTFFCATKQR